MCHRGWDSICHQSRPCGNQVTLHRSTTVCSPTRLNVREFQVVYLASLGRSGKEAASELGLSHSRVRLLSSTALQKLSLAGSTQLPAFWCTLGRGAKPISSRPGREIVIFDAPLATRQPAQLLTIAEREVLSDVLEGRQTEDIARRRCTSVRTVANQIARLFRKFGVTSRGELAAKALGVEPCAEHAAWVALGPPTSEDTT